MERDSAQPVSIPLTQGRVLIVDAQDAEYVRSLSCLYALQRKSTTPIWYAVTRIDGKLTRIHQLLMPGHGRIDHIDGDGLNNRRSNLRPATHAENMQNRKRHTNNKSGFKGVYWHKGHKCWTVQLTCDGRRITRYGFPTPEDAAIAYDDLAREYFGDFACVNFPSSDDKRKAG